MEESKRHTAEKERGLQLALIQLNTAKDEIKRLSNEVNRSKRKYLQDIEREREELSKASKYGAAEVISLKQQIDMIRMELHKEKTSR